MIQINILWQDLNENMHNRLAKVFGEEILKHHNNWDVVPLAICEIDDDKDAILDSWTGDVFGSKDVEIWKSEILEEC